MRLYSTKHEAAEVSFKEAVFKGLPEDNGLYLPINIPRLPDVFYDSLHALHFSEIAYEVASALIGDEIKPEALKLITDDAFDFPVPLKRIDDNTHILELFHGPTLAFKDFGARFMSRIMKYFLASEDKEITILVATSGDTGGAVGSGFLGLEGVKVVILYPGGKISELQERQLTTLGQNVSALKVEGTFDDCQALVKKAFLDGELNNQLRLSSANSINISRMIPQSFYYFYAVGQANIPEIVFSVPSGNLGNLSGGLLAQKMGLPVRHFIAASNANATFPDYLHTGIYQPRASIETISNAMDVGAPSNFARINDWYPNEITNNISGYSFNDEQTKAAILEMHENEDYILCPHTAVGYLGLKKYQEDHNIPGIILSTAHPAKFQDSLEEILNKPIKIPDALSSLLNKDKNFTAIKNSYKELTEFLLE